MTFSPLDSVNAVKKPKDNKPLTKKEKEEIIKCDNDLKYFLRNYCWIQNPSRGAMLFDFRDYQERVIDAIANNQFIISLLPRQSGKCLDYNSLINIRNRKTGEIIEIPIGDFFDLCKNNS